MRSSRWSRRRPVLLGASLLVGAGLLASACGTGPGAASGPGSTITLYNAQHEQTIDALITAFTKQTGIEVRVDNDAEDVLTAQIEQEGSRSPADVFYTENSNWLQQLDDRGLLARVDSSTLAHVPAPDSATNGDWVGVSARISAIVYNPSLISASQLPKSVMGMADPEYRGEFELAPSETDFWPIVDSIARAKGNPAALAWLEGVRANAGANDAVPDNETLTSDVSQGITDFALINTYYLSRLEAEVGRGSVHAKLAYFEPGDPGYVEDVSGAAILRSSKHKAAAQEFLAFITSAAGQRVLAHSESFEYPLHPGVAASGELTPLADLHPTDFTPADLGTGLDAKRLLQQSGIL